MPSVWTIFWGLLGVSSAISALLWKSITGRTLPEWLSVWTDKLLRRDGGVRELLPVRLSARRIKNWVPYKDAGHMLVSPALVANYHAMGQQVDEANIVYKAAPSDHLEFSKTKSQRLKQLQIAMSKYAQAQGDIDALLLKQLKSGALIARGYPVPATASLTPTVILPSEWNFETGRHFTEIEVGDPDTR